jgi:hypothetical protein
MGLRNSCGLVHAALGREAGSSPLTGPLEGDRACNDAQAKSMSALNDAWMWVIQRASKGMRVKRGDKFSAAPVFVPNRPPPDPKRDPPICPSRHRDYGVRYELARLSAHLCLYRGVSARTSRYPIVRYTTLFYGSNGAIDYASIEEGHELVRVFLAATPHLAGVPVRPSRQ